MLHGSSIGGGFLLGLSADHRLATVSAIFRLGVAPYGLSPIVMATGVLPLLVGRSLARRIYVEDLTIPASRAFLSDFIDVVFSDCEVSRERALSCAGVLKT